MNNKNLYKFMGKIALEFRVSLDSLCKMLGKEATDDTKMNIYNLIISSSNADVDLKEMFNYLFFYETINEPENISKVAYARAINYVKRYQKAQKEGNDKEILKELNKTENDLLEIKNEIGKTPLTEKQVEIIEKYRIKYVISMLAFSNNFGIPRATLDSRQKNITDVVLRTKLDCLADYYLQKSQDRLRKKGI